MKLSEAIRLGSMLGPQAFGVLRMERNSKVWTCARGAALLAVGLKDWSQNDVVAHEHWPILYEEGLVSSRCCECDRAYHSALLVFAIIHLNDSHRWTRERIADFVEQIENAQAQQTVPEPTLAALRRG